jgi:hypothetical protein
MRFNTQEQLADVETGAFRRRGGGHEPAGKPSRMTHEVPVRAWP